MDTRSRLWQEIRAIRAVPPGKAATDPERRAVLGASLRQAQEFADAAAVSGYATKPLPLYYALGQGLRAVCAVHLDDDAWRIRGHGARVEARDPLLSTIISPAPRVTTNTRDALTALHDLVGADAPSTDMSLEAVWSACIESPLSADLGACPHALRLHVPPADSVRENNIRNGWIELAVEGGGVDLESEALLGTIADYPSLAGATCLTDVGDRELTEDQHYLSDRMQVRFNPQGRLLHLGAYHPWMETSPVLRWPLESADASAYEAAYRRIAPSELSGRRTPRIALPSIGGTQHPDFLALEFLRLLALSSLVRYEPAAWITAVDFDQSRLAVPLEEVCDHAETFVPAILKEALTVRRP